MRTDTTFPLRVYLRTLCQERTHRGAVDMMGKFTQCDIVFRTVTLIGLYENKFWSRPQIVVLLA